MRKILRHYLVVTYSLWIASKIAGGMIFEKGTQTLLISSIVFMLSSLLAKPVINILLLPINLVTFGLFRWVSSAIVLYLVTLVIPSFKLINFNFTGYVSKWIELPPLQFERFFAFVAFAFIISTITSIIFWVIK